MMACLTVHGYVLCFAVAIVYYLGCVLLPAVPLSHVSVSICLRRVACCCRLLHFEVRYCTVVRLDQCERCNQSIKITSSHNRRDRLPSRSLFLFVTTVGAVSWLHACGGHRRLVYTCIGLMVMFLLGSCFVDSKDETRPPQRVYEWALEETPQGLYTRQEQYPKILRELITST